MVLNDGVDARGRVWVGCKLLAPASADADATSPGRSFARAARRVQGRRRRAAAPRRSSRRSAACTRATA